MLVPVRATTFSSSATSAGLFLAQRLKFVEDRFQQRRYKDAENQQRNGDHPEPQPVAARPAAHDPVEEQQHGRAKQKGKAQRLGLVATPTAPSLHADAVAAAEMVAENIEGQAGQGADDQKSCEKEQSLHPAAAQQALSPAGQCGSKAGSQQQPQENQAPNRAGNIQNVADAAEGDGLGQLIGRQGISLRGGLGWGRLRLGSWCGCWGGG